LDGRLISLASKHQLEYTRHGDDLNFSGKHIDDSFKKIVKDLVRKSGFNLNEEKERFIPHHKAQSVVGLRVNRKLPRVDREKRRDWRRRKFRFDKFGSELFPEDEIYEKEMQTIQGQQSYINYINKGGNHGT
jgi:hypothetical protein